MDLYEYSGKRITCGSIDHDVWLVVIVDVDCSNFGLK